MRAIGGAKLGEKSTDMVADGAWAEMQRSSDLAIGKPAHQQAQDLRLARRERIDERPLALLDQVLDKWMRLAPAPRLTVQELAEQAGMLERGGGEIARKRPIEYLRR